MKTIYKKNQNLVVKLIYTLTVLITVAVNGIGQTYFSETGFRWPLDGELNINFSNNGGYYFGQLAVYSGGTVYHPGEDWNIAGTSCNGDAGEPVYAVANGIVVYSNTGSWGGIVIMHNYKGEIYYSQYGHVQTSFVSVNDIVTKGQKIAEIGDVGTACAHLHFEIRNSNHPEPLKGYYWTYGSTGLGNESNVLSWYSSPTSFIPNHLDEYVIINSNMDIYGGSKTKPIQLTVWFEKKGLENPISVENFKIGSVSYSNIISDDNYDPITGKGSFKVNLQNFDISYLSNKAYDISFKIDGIEFFGKNQLYFLDPEDFVYAPSDLPDADRVYWDDWFARYVYLGLSYGFYKGDGISKFFPNSNLTRAEMAKIVVTAALKLGLLEINTSTETHHFADVLPNDWFFPYVQTLVNYGYIDKNTDFNPYQAITAGAFAKILVNAFQLKSSEINNNQINNGNGVKGSRLLIQSTNPDFQEPLEIISNIINVKIDYTGLKFIEHLGRGLHGTGITEIQDNQVIATGDNIVTRAIMAKVLANAYKFRFDHPLSSQNKSTPTIKTTEDLSNWTVIGDKFELTSSTSGVVPEDSHRTKTLTTGEVWDLGELLTEVGGFPVTYYWTVNGGTLEEVNPNNIHNHVKFTAPDTPGDIDMYLCIQVGNGKNYIYTWDITVNKETVEAPTVQASNIHFGVLSSTTIPTNWDRGSGDYCIVTITEGTTVAIDQPNYNVVYSGNSNFLQAQPVFNGSDTKVVYTGTGNYVNITGVNSSSSYQIAVYEYNGNTTDNIQYLLSSPAYKTVVVPNPPTIIADFNIDPTEVYQNHNVTFGATPQGTYTDVSWNIPDATIVQTYSGSITVNFPNSGTFPVSCTVSNSNTGISDEATKNIQVLEEALMLPDMQIANVNSPSTVMLNAQFNVSLDIINTGKTQSGNQFVSTKIYASGDDIFDSNDYLLAEIGKDYPNGLLENSSEKIYFDNISISSSNIYPTNKLLIITDFTNQINEADETNNMAIVDITTTDAMPDVYISDATLVTNNFFSGDTIKTQITIKNSGTRAYENIGWVYTYISNDNILDENDFKINYSIYLNGVPLNSSIILNSDVKRIPVYWENGNYYVIFEFSPYSDVDMDLTNNTFSIPITISNPNQPTVQASNLQISNITDNSLTVSWTNGDGDERILVGRYGFFPSFPNDNQVYSDNTDFVSAEIINDGGTYTTKALYSGISNIANISNLTSGVDYYFSVFEYNTPEYDYFQNNGWYSDQERPRETIVCHVPLNEAISWKKQYNEKLASETKDRNIIFFNDQTGYILSPWSILKTIDGGKTWKNMVFEYNDNDLETMFFLNEQKGWVVNGQKIYKTKDGANTWTLIDPQIDMNIYGIYFVDDNIGYLSGEHSDFIKDGSTTLTTVTSGELFKTTDGGVTWTSVLETDKYLHALTFLNKDTGFVVGYRGIIYKTIDGGVNWTDVDPNPSDDEYAVTIEFVNENLGWQVSYPSDKMYITTNGGINWSIIQLPEDFRTTDAYVINENIFYATGIDCVIKSIDGGQTWDTVFNNIHISDIQCLDENNVLIGSSLGGFYKTNTGGEPQAINLSNISFEKTTSYCTGSLFDLTFSILGDGFNADNIFTVQLSDMNGFFGDNPIELAALQSNTDGTISNITIPENMGSSDKYRIRIVSSNPVSISNESDYIEFIQTPQTYITEDLPLSYYTNSPSQTIASFGSPTGGIFTLDTVVVTEINPANLSIGEHILNYTYSNGTCENTTSRIINILEPNSINCQDISGSEYCAAGQIDVKYTVSGNYDENNMFIIELSDKNGSFINATEIAYDYTVDSGEITCILPYYLEEGDNYIVRIRSTNPEIISNETNVFSVNAISETSVEIVTDKESICEGDSVFVSANYSGTDTPSFNWKINGNTVSDNPYNFTAKGLNNGDIINLQIVSNAVCAFPKTVNSNNINITVKNNVTPWVELYVNHDSICELETTTISADTYDMGDNPVYLWQINSVNVDENTSELVVDTLTGNSLIRLKVLSNEICTTTDEVEVTYQIIVDKIPEKAETPTGEVELYQNPDNQSYSTSTLENTTDYEWVLTPENAGIIFASQNNAIIDFEDTYLGAVFLKVRGMNGKCSGEFSDDLLININQLTNVMNIENIEFNISPNPTSGIINIEYENMPENVRLIVMDILGKEIIHNQKLLQKGKLSIDLSGKSKGIYIVRIEGINFTKDSKVILK